MRYKIYLDADHLICRIPKINKTISNGERTIKYLNIAAIEGHNKSIMNYRSINIGMSVCLRLNNLYIPIPSSIKIKIPIV